MARGGSHSSFYDMWRAISGTGSWTRSGLNLNLAPPATQSSQWAYISLTQEFLTKDHHHPITASGMPLCPVSLGTQDSLAAILHPPVCLHVAWASPLLEVARD